MAAASASTWRCSVEAGGADWGAAHHRCQAAAGTLRIGLNGSSSTRLLVQPWRLPPWRPPSRAYFGDRSKAPLPAERIADVALVNDPDTAHIICPWPRGPLDLLNETRLLTVLARTDKLKPAGPCWGWPDPYRDPWPVEAPHPRSWLVRWAEGKASYVARRGCKCWALTSTIFVEVEGREWDAD